MTEGLRSTYYPAAGAMRVQAGSSNEVYYVLKDHLGSASTVTNASGTVVGEQRYDPFGATRWSMGSLLTDQLYTGQREMEGLGIYHYKARFYSPTLGRFLSPDTIIPDLTNPQSLNRFSYVLNNPILYNDPDGREANNPIIVPPPPVLFVILVVVVIAVYVLSAPQNGVTNQTDEIPPDPPDDGLDYSYRYRTPTLTPLPIVNSPTGTNCPVPMNCSWTSTPKPTKTPQQYGPPVPASSTPTANSTLTQSLTKTPKKAPTGTSVNYWDLINQKKKPINLWKKRHRGEFEE